MLKPSAYCYIDLNRGKQLQHKFSENFYEAWRMNKNHDQVKNTYI